jgi:HK97 family phage major capsid protein
MDRLTEARTAHTEAVQRMHDASQTFESVDITDAAATTEARDAFNTAKTEADTLAQRVKDLEAIAEARAGAPLPDSGLEGSKITSREPNTYSRHNPGNSWLLDVARSETGRGELDEARGRLARHAKEQKETIERRRAVAEQRAASELGQMLADLERVNPALARSLAEQGLVEKRAVSRVDTTSAGEFVPPLWLIDLFAPLARAARPFADQVRNIPLPGGTDSINVPRVTTGFLTGVQTADNAAVTSQDMISATVTAPVRTVAGNADIAMQLLDQSPINFDEVVFGDLFADYALQLDTQVIGGSGVAGQLLGITNVSGVNAVTFTTGAPTLPLLWPKLADATQQSAVNRKIWPSAAWVHGRRFAWMAKELDTSSRPFITVTTGGPTNAYGQYASDFTEAQGGPFTNLIGVPYYVDLSLPTNQGDGTRDQVIVTRMEDHILFEGDLQARVLKEVLSGTLGVRFQVYAYVAFTAARFPVATSIVSGSGLTTPTF